jgi:hypothetical protein
MKKLKLILISLLVLGLVLPDYSALRASSQEEETAIEEESLAGGASAQGIPEKKPQEAKYVPGQLIVKLKEGKTLGDIRDLNAKYNVTSSEKVFKDTPSPQQTLDELKAKYNALGSPSSDSWYRQLNNKEYLAQIEQEKQELQEQIKAQEGLVTDLQERQKRAEEGVETPKLDNIYTLTTDKDTDIPSMAQAYSQNPNVEYAEPNYLLKLQSENYRTICDPLVIYPPPKNIQNYPLDPFLRDLANQWGKGDFHRGGVCEKPDLPTQWGYIEVNGECSQCARVTVAVIDTGIDPTHPDLRHCKWLNQGEWGKNGELAHDGIDNDKNGFIDDFGGWNFYKNINDFEDWDGHGTMVAGIIAGKRSNGIGIVGLDDCIRIMPLRGTSDYREIAAAIRYAADNGADVINISQGQDVPIQSNNLIVEAIKYAQTRGRKGKGCIVIAGAGNNGNSSFYGVIANIEGVIRVGAINSCKKLCEFSNYDTSVVAPGEDIFTTLSRRHETGDLQCVRIDKGTYAVGKGTSFAAPYVSALAALILKKYPSLSYREINQVILMSTEDLGIAGMDPEYGAGVVNYQKFLDYFVKHKNGIDRIQAKIAELNISADNRVIGIKGTAAGDDFRVYYLEYALRYKVSEYGEREYSKFVQFKRDTRPHKNELLGELDTSNFPAGKYIIRLTVEAKDGCKLSDYKYIEIKATKPPAKPIVEDNGDWVNSNYPVLEAWWDKGINNASIDFYEYRVRQKNVADDVISWKTTQSKHAAVRKDDLPEEQLKEGITYYFDVKADNNAGMQSPVGSSDGITVDTIPPETKITIESQTVTFSAKDAVSGVKKTLYSIDGLAMKIYRYPFTISGSGRHRIKYYSVDRAGNIEKAHQRQLEIDTTPPIIDRFVINNGASSTKDLKVTLSISARDTGSGLNQMCFSNDGTHWSKPEPYATTKKWTLAPVVAFSNTSVYMMVSDHAGNYTRVEDDIYYNGSPLQPLGWILINNDAKCTSSQEVTLSLGVLYSVSTPVQMQLRNAGKPWQNPEPYRSTKDWQLPVGAGEKVVYAKFKDSEGNWSEPVSDDILLDPNCGAGRDNDACKLLIDNGASSTPSAMAQLTATCKGAYWIDISNDGFQTYLTEKYDTIYYGWQLSAGYGTKTVSARFKDAEGNILCSCSDSIEYVKP